MVPNALYECIPLTKHKMGFRGVLDGVWKKVKWVLDGVLCEKDPDPKPPFFPVSKPHFFDKTTFSKTGF